MKKTKFSPVSEQHHHFLIYDVATTLPEYLLAFHINKNLNMHFIRENDFDVHNPATGNTEKFTLYVFEEHENQKYYLVHNLKDENPLMLNYFLFVEGSFHKEMEVAFVQSLRNIDNVLNVNRISLSGSAPAKPASKKTVEMINSLLTDLEYHLSDINRLKAEKKNLVSPFKKPEIKKLYDA